MLLIDGVNMNTTRALSIQGSGSFVSYIRTLIYIIQTEYRECEIILVG